MEVDAVVVVAGAVVVVEEDEVVVDVEDDAVEVELVVGCADVVEVCVIVVVGVV